MAMTPGGQAYTYNGSVWSGAMPTGAVNLVTSVSCASASFCVAVTLGGSGTDASALVYTNGSWSAPQYFNGQVDSFSSVSCAPGTTFCVAVGTNYSGSSGGTAWQYDNGSWTAMIQNDPQFPNSFLSVSCVSMSFCVAADVNGGAATYSGGSWSAHPGIDSFRLTSVSCAAASFCVAVDSQGDVLTTNDGSTWTSQPIDSTTNNPYAVSCAPGLPAFCVVVDLAGNAIVFSGGAWSVPSVADTKTTPTAVSCASATLCAIVDSDGLAWTGPAAVPPPSFKSGPSYVYWSDGHRFIGRAPRQPFGRQHAALIHFIRLAKGSDPSGLAVTAHFIYWAEPLEGRIGRATIDGKHVNEHFIRGLGQPESVAVYGEHVYWTDLRQRAIGRANLAGGHVQPRFIRGLGTSHYGPVAVAVDSGHIYWSYCCGNHGIGRARLDGLFPDRHFFRTGTGNNVFGGLASDGSYLYWTVFTRTAVGTIAPIVATRGGQASPRGKLNLPRGTEPAGPALCAGEIYWANEGLGSIGRAQVDGNTGSLHSPNRTWINRLNLAPAQGDPAVPGVAVGGCPAPMVTGQPADQSVTGYKTATFIAAGAGNPAPSVQWQVSTTEGETWRDIPGATGNSFSLLTNATENGNEYRARVTNAAGWSATSAPATLTVLPVVTTRFAGYSAYLPTFRPGGALYNAVSANWTVPSVTCPPGVDTWAAEWPGIGANGNVVQDGTQVSCNYGTPAYDGWYEFLGDQNVNGGNPVSLSTSQYPISPGDAIVGSVSYANSTWTVSLEDTTKGWAFSFSAPDTTPGLNRSVAQALVEGPPSPTSTFGLANFGSVHFTGVTAELGSQSGSITQFAPIALEMTCNGCGTRARAFPLSSTGDFSINWYGQ